MLAISTPIRLVASTLVGIVAVVLPETGWIDQESARAVVVLSIILLGLLLGPPIIAAVRPSVHVTRPSVRVEAAPLVKEWRARRRGKDAAAEPIGTRRTLHEIGASAAVVERESEPDTEAPNASHAQGVYAEPQPWANVPFRYIGDGRQFHIGVPADPTKTLYATEERVGELVATGLYLTGPVDSQAPESDDPPSADELGLRPPRARLVPRDAWVSNQREHWCGIRESLIGEGSVLLSELQAVPPTAPTSENDRFSPRVHAWRTRFESMIRTYWDDDNASAVIGQAQADGARYEATAMGPGWAKTKAGLIGAPLAWLETQPSDCDWEWEAEDADTRERLAERQAERDHRLALDDLGVALEALTGSDLDPEHLPAWRRRVEDWIEAEGEFVRKRGEQSERRAWERNRDLGVVPLNPWRDHLLQVLFRFNYWPNIEREDGRSWSAWPR